MDTEETSVYTAVLISCIVISVIIIYFAISIIRQQRKKIELTRQNMLIEISTMEKERSRIATDLHDDLGPVLSVVKFQIDNVNVDDAGIAQLQSASKQIDESIQKLREIANNLMPSSLLRKGLFSSIQEFIRSVESNSNAKLNYTNNCHSKIPEDLSIHIYRVVKEVIHNGLKHANASEITVDCSEQNNILSILYMDNGVGFDYEKALSESTGFGIRNLKGRIEVLRGTMTVESKLNKGTALLFKIPVK